ncbi:hypothetical protein L7E35_004946 [Vibrio parahaemolyticus]|uniref:hypothetical protein n=1 Tax=Vibrio parahaemolyticus TaxID=670 RepID=UPI001A1CCCBC|nr:hypothetical protein [Vibrio parahaemolyticus]EGQ7740941.1 hypothetical protein [Vibrio parahaemolyticus]EHZ2727259.1 hypothetical protein [Vibrio parahaemolyticus]EIV1599983.1 hypothetical protein [Vibrio parahaemolyticus]EJG1399043.1 hypothetical protein [Vibrio parahaemolyticus]MCR9713918.1 hypothetical protein [Vibrio parahaemolyticus]
MTEHEKELKRMADRVKSLFNGIGPKPYTGRTDDIDITSEPLFCPSCGHDEPMRLNQSKTAVSCVNPKILGWCGEYCDYEYALTAERQRTDCFWTSGFEYPKTRREVLQARLEGRTNRLKELPKLRKEARERFKKEEKKLTEEIASIIGELEKTKVKL